MAKRQYSGATHGMVTGIGLVNLVHSSGEAGDFLPLDFRIYAPQQDGLTKNDHFQAMFKQVVKEGNIQARTLLFDSWYASSENLKVIHRADWTFFTTLKSNRLVSLSKETGYQALDTLQPPAQGWSRGVEVRVQQVPFGLRLFKLVATDGSIEWVITNHLAAHLNREMVIEAVQVRWQIAEFQAVDGVGEMPVPHGAGAAKSLDVLLFSVGVAAAACPGDWPHDVSGGHVAVGRVATPAIAKAIYSCFTAPACVSPIR